MNFVKQLPNYLDYLIPINEELVRLGCETDGGYLIPKTALDKANALLSFGLGENWTFDEDWYRLHPNDPVHLYDGEKIKATLPLPQNVWNRPAPVDLVAAYDSFFQDKRRHWVENMGNARGACSFGRAMERLAGHQVFLKSDIEGGEYPILADIISHKDRIVGIAAEFHSVNSNRALFETAMRSLQQHYTIVHVHANITLPIGKEGLTEAIEISWLRNDLVTSDQRRYNLYHELDRPNFLGFPDYEYWFEQQ
jgi:hypothetical protein